MNLAFCLLIRTFLSSVGAQAQAEDFVELLLHSEKLKYICFFARLFVPLSPNLLKPE